MRKLQKEREREREREREKEEEGEGEGGGSGLTVKTAKHCPILSGFLGRHC